MNWSRFGLSILLLAYISWNGRISTVEACAFFLLVSSFCVDEICDTIKAASK